MKTITYYYRGSVERGTGRGYKWVTAYSANSEDGLPLYPWNTKSECRADAQSQGAKAVFVETKQANA